ncbi:MAG: VWA domain-containing protein [Verrucomicrobia bacterium]|nr:VWA domain-containing protein [Verrucomicrobiota bacterium]
MNSESAIQQPNPPDFQSAGSRASSGTRRFRPGFWLAVAILGSLLFHVWVWYWFQRTYLPYHTMPSREKFLLRKFRLDRAKINPEWVQPKLAAPEHTSPTPSPDRSSLAPTEEKRTFARLLAQAPTTPSSPTMPAGSPPIPDDKPIPALGDPGNTPLEAATRSQLDQQLRATSEQQIKKSGKTTGAGRPILNTPGAPVAPKPGSVDLEPPTQAKVGPSQGPVTGDGSSAFTASSRLDDFFGPGGLPPPPPPPPPPPEKPKPVDPATLVPQGLPSDKPKTTQKYESLNPFLNVDLFTLERWGSSGKREGYFLIRITAKPNQHLRVIPKDVYFVLDVSSSIGRTRLDAYRSAVMAAISQLNPSDRFKILAFRGKLMAFRQDWLSAQDPPLDEVRSWFADLKSGGVTDFYDGLRPLTLHTRQPDRMAMAMVMSDGVPTVGLLDSTQIIRDLSEANDNKTSIFTLSMGKDVNNFLLDFLSYGNQGRLKYEEKVERSVDGFGKLVEQVRNPLFLDLRFHFAGVDGAQVCPQNLPNLYQDSPLLLFGRYTPGQTAPISLQILGESFNSTKELLVELPIPKTPQGPEILPSTWARQRIYHLLGQMTRSRVRQDAIFAEVRKLSEEYQVPVPYF